MHLLTQEPLRTEFYLNNVFMYYVCMYLCIYVCVFIHAQLFVAPWTVGHQASLSMGFPRQEYWDGGRVVFAGSYPRGSSWLRIEPTSSESPALSGRFFTNTCTHTHTHTHTCTLLCVYMCIWGYGLPFHSKLHVGDFAISKIHLIIKTITKSLHLK